MLPPGRGRGNGLRHAALQFDGNNMDVRDERHYPLVDGRSPHRHYPALYVRLLTPRCRESFRLTSKSRANTRAQSRRYARRGGIHP
ncbi:hypothetical protein CN220_31430 [Sinorhizobium meliloti]|nr:hypothetical protein CN238_14995 [Sinorhizobium meliloti]RVG60897.1 hypothetical protein CN220_31430 [Sinorhizobium meliloti]RVH28779.1 hypothetical protein CN211_25095 [Sinorhizobium meliloti]RVH29941.1 hypothetical protein CN214_15075 [Sinorhizobium meliloti]